VVDVVTVKFVEAPAARVADAPPLDAKTADVTCGTEERLSVAVRDAPLTLVIRKTLENVRADGTVPRSIERPSTFPAATGVDVPGCRSVPGETEK
jgi:hypothetical protein